MTHNSTQHEEALKAERDTLRNRIRDIIYDQGATSYERAEAIMAIFDTRPPRASLDTAGQVGDAKPFHEIIREPMSDWTEVQPAGNIYKHALELLDKCFYTDPITGTELDQEAVKEFMGMSHVIRIALEDSRKLQRLLSALYIISKVHLKDELDIGFSIQHGAYPDWCNGVGQREYVNAWEIIYEELLNHG